MSILLQNKQTQRYVRSVGCWTVTPEEAHGFITAIEALYFCQDNALFHMQVVLKFADGCPDIVFAVTDSRWI